MAATEASAIGGAGVAANGLSYLQTRGHKRALSSLDGGTSIAFQSVGGFALVVGQPVGPVETWGPLLRDFEALCDSERLSAAFCGVNSSGLTHLRERGYRSVRVGDEAVVDLSNLHLKGGRWRECRAALNRAERRGVTLQWIAPGRLTEELLRELRGVSDEWLARRRLPELAFLLGDSGDLADPRCLLAVARGDSGRAEGFVTWTPVPGTGGWMLDMMRRRADAMSGLMDFLIVGYLLRMKRDGLGTASLGGTPLSNVGGETGGPLRWALNVAFRHGRLGYRFRPLHHFKRKFNPHWEPLYLAVQPGGAPAGALGAVLRACLTGVRPGHLVRAVAGIR